MPRHQHGPSNWNQTPRGDLNRQNDRHWQGDRDSLSDDRIMRRGDDRTRTGDNFGMSRRDSYRPDDDRTDTESYRAGDRHSHIDDRGMAYGRNFDRAERSSWGRGGENSYGWSNDYRASGDYRPSFPGSNRWSSNDMQRGETGFGSNYGQGYFSSAPSQTPDFPSSSNSPGYSPSYGPHSGKGPKNYRRSDDRIREDACEALERHPQIDASEIEVEVKDGVVTLRGHVEERRLKRLAEDSIESVSGVRDVRNELQVDQTLFQQARSALFGPTAESESATSASKTMKSKH